MTKPQGEFETMLLQKRNEHGTGVPYVQYIIIPHAHTDEGIDEEDRARGNNRQVTERRENQRLSRPNS